METYYNPADLANFSGLAKLIQKREGKYGTFR